MKVDAPLRVQVPVAGADHTSWARVGLIAVAGFAIGVGWPRLMGARLGPSLPADSSTSSPASRQEPAAPSPATSVHAAPLASATSVTPPASASAAPTTAAMPALTVNHGVLLSCRSEEGETLKGVGACGGLAGFDAIAQPRLRKLSTCPAASASTSGKLSIVFNLDFSSKHVAADVGKSSTVGDPQGFATCVKGAFQGVSLGALDHQNPRYTIGYNVVFTPTDHGSAPATTTPSGPADGVPAAVVSPSAPSAPSTKAPADDSSAEIAWDVAIVRDAPRTGAVVARLPRGTKVKLGSGQDGWYKIEYGPASEGWVYRGAVGR
jgi:hypothetical protein